MASIDSKADPTLAEVDATKRDASDSVAGVESTEEPPSKKARLDETPEMKEKQQDARDRGIAPIKAEYRISAVPRPAQVPANADDAAEATSHTEREEEKKDRKKKKKPTGQNTNRSFGSSKDEKGLCMSVAFTPEFSPKECQFGDKCRFEHDLRTYLKQYKREDLTTFNGLCPVWDARGTCAAGWRCRLVSTHSTERETEDGKKELILLEDEERKQKAQLLVPFANADRMVNIISQEDKVALARKKETTPRANQYNEWLTTAAQELEKFLHGKKKAEKVQAEANGDSEEPKDESKEEPNEGSKQVSKEEREEHRAQYTEPPFMPSEKRRIYFGPETPTLAPLTTQGNMPFRRLCTDLGAQFTYSEMAMSMPLIQGNKSEWTLLKAHESEMLPPSVIPGDNIVQGYDNSKDFKFGAQITANKPWQALKATEVLSKFTPNLRVIDLNCGCPIELVFRDGAGSALLDHHSKLEKIIRGMNAVSQEIPITVKIRMGTKDNFPTALKLVERVVLGGHESSILNVGPPGAAAITLHGRSRQQRYTRQADWSYIADCAALIKRLNEKKDDITDTVREPDARYQPNGGRTYFLGNGDCYSHVDYDNHIKHAGVDSVMIARGALIKPWLFEEIQTGQYLDKSASERLAYIEKFAKYGLETWGSDEHGVGTTRRFLLEWLSFAYRYTPIGLLEYLPPKINHRPPAYRGRNELETLMASGNCKDWIKLTEMFLGPAHPDFKFDPKHKSNAYEEAEGTRSELNQRIMPYFANEYRYI
ncbi:tRNA-dihydrouridine(47) synthase [Penicillium argentinense]|uniref:tRNA-dihydrouridine(47) synthase [NAD(P)(+)] n=1 Tax=Penicillium argentinense TaxID=1131581 RepID=A0A9W9EWI9_9EURO|nr:tRNA-dihydrouridine(47) synthase [Penicillium argentinense]KAJ5089328.1 tRNA-dihydrouridine(47) synthase [Penicillium argentinense]